MRKKSKEHQELDEALSNFEKYLLKIKKANPRKPTDFERHTGQLLFAVGNAESNILRGLTDVKNGINIQTIVVAIGFFGLGIMFIL